MFLIRKIIASLEQREKNDIRASEGILKLFLKFLLKKKLSVQNLEDLTNNITNSISVTSHPKIGKSSFVNRMSVFLTKNSIIKHFLVVIGCILVALVAGLVGFLIGVSLNYVYGGALGLFGVLIGGYLHYVKK